MDLEVGVGELGKAFEDRDQLPGLEVGDELAGDLDEDPVLRRAGDEVDGDQGVEGVLGAMGWVGFIGLGKVDRASISCSKLVGSTTSGLSYPEVADVGVVGTARPGERGGCLGGVLGRGADAEAGAHRGVDREAFGQRDHRFADLRAGRSLRGSSRPSWLTARLKSKPVAEEARSVVGWEKEVVAKLTRSQRLQALRVAFGVAADRAVADPGARLLPGVGAGREVERAGAGGGQGEEGLGLVVLRRARPCTWPSRRRVRPRLGSCRVRVVGDRPGGAPDRHRDAIDREALGEVLGFEVEAIFAFGVAHLAGEGDRLPEGGGAELGGDPGRRDEIEEAEGAGAAAVRAERIVTVPTWLRSGQLSPERLVRRERARGVELGQGALADDAGVADQPRGQFEAQVAQVGGGEGHAGLAGGFGALVEVDLADDCVGVGAGFGGRAAITVNRLEVEAFGTGLEAQIGRSTEGGCGEYQLGGEYQEGEA